MANLNKLIPFILKWEGGYVNDPNDLGGTTNKGVTLKVWQKVGYDKNDDGVIDEEDLKQIFVNDLIECVLRPEFWDVWKADRIRNQSIANILVDWMWASGKIAITTTQRMLNVDADGKVGEQTLAAINDYPNQQELFNRIKAERVAYIERICRSRPANLRFKKGWLNRLNDIKFAYTVLVCFLLSCFTGCKSVATSESVMTGTKTETHAEKDSEQQSQTRWDAVLSKHSDSTENIETVIETITVRFDSASPDSITGKHPVKEVSRTRITQGKNVRSSVSEELENHRTDSSVTRVKETTDRKSAESVKTWKMKISTPSGRLYAIGALFLFIFLIGWILWKKKPGFFLRL